MVQGANEEATEPEILGYPIQNFKLQNLLNVFN